MSRTIVTIAVLHEPWLEPWRRRLREAFNAILPFPAFLRSDALSRPPGDTRAGDDPNAATSTGAESATGTTAAGPASSGAANSGDPLGVLVAEALAEYPHATTAFEALVRRTWSPVFQVCQAILLNTHDAEEVAQEVFLRAHRYLEGYRGDSTFLSWLRRIARNAALTRLDARRREAGARERVARDPLLRFRWGEQPTRGANSLSLDIVRALSALGPDDRMVVVLHDLAGVPHAEIAGELGVSSGAVRMRLSRAREKLRERLARVPDGRSR